MTNTAKPELKPCPFCGFEDVHPFYLGEKSPPDVYEDYWSIACDHCVVSPVSDFVNKHDAIEVWNARAPQWQPIETAPKDGTNIIAYIPSYIPYGGGFVMQTHMRNDRCHPYWWDENGEVCPSHWMPLPTPPSDNDVVYVGKKCAVHFCNSKGSWFPELCDGCDHLVDGDV